MFEKKSDDLSVERWETRFVAVFLFAPSSPEKGIKIPKRPCRFRGIEHEAALSLSLLALSVDAFLPEEEESSKASDQRPRTTRKKQKKDFDRKKKKETHLQRLVVAPSPVSSRGALAREFLDQGGVVPERSVVVSRGVFRKSERERERARERGGA